MRKKTDLILILLLFIGFAMFGAWKKTTYTNITADPDYMNRFRIAEIPANFASEDLKLLESRLPSAPIVLRASPSSPAENFFGGRMQLVKAEAVFKGSGIRPGDEFYVSSPQRLYPEDLTADFGFVNDMKQGDRYLLFLEEKIPSVQGDTKDVYRLTSGDMIRACFNYRSIENRILPPTDQTTYVPYEPIRDNEFFATDQEGMDAFHALKEKAIRQYPSGP